MLFLMIKSLIDGEFVVSFQKVYEDLDVFSVPGLKDE
jgi:hypothetical protein